MAKQILYFLRAFLGKFLEDFLILLGLFFIIFTTFKVNFVAGMYSTGAILLVLGILLAKRPPEGR